MYIINNLINPITKYKITKYNKLKIYKIISINNNKLIKNWLKINNIIICTQKL